MSTVLEHAVKYHQFARRSLLRSVTAAGPGGINARALFEAVRSQVDAEFGDGKYTWDLFESDLTRLTAKRRLKSSARNIRLAS